MVLATLLPFIDSFPLHEVWPCLDPSCSHFGRQLRMVLLEFSGTFRVADYHCIDRTTDNTHQDAAKDEADDETDAIEIRNTH